MASERVRGGLAAISAADGGNRCRWRQAQLVPAGAHPARRASFPAARGSPGSISPQPGVAHRNAVLGQPGERPEPMRRLARPISLIAACALLAACAEHPTMMLDAAADDLFDKSAPVSVSGSHAVTDRHGYVVGGAGEGLGVGMAAGALGSIQGGAQTGDPLGLALGIVLAPVFAVGFGIYGAAAAHSSEETEAAFKAIDRVCDDDGLLSRVEALIGQKMASLGFPEEPGCGKAVTGTEGRHGGSSSGLSGGACFPEASRNTLRLKIIYSFATEGAYSPDLSIKIELSAVAANADRTRTAREFRWMYLSPKFDFFAATAGDAAGLRQRLSNAQEKLADEVVQDLFLARRPVKVAGRYFREREGENFIPDAISPGTASRVPTRSQLLQVPEDAVENENPEPGYGPSMDALGSGSPDPAHGMESEKYQDAPGSVSQPPMKGPELEFPDPAHGMD